MGIPSLMAYVAILIVAGRMTVKVSRAGPQMPLWMVQTMRGLAWGQIAFGIFGLADAISLGAKTSVFFWMSLAIMTSIYLYGRDRGLLETKSSASA